MQKERHFYLFKVQFLGFRYSGWQKQPGQKTIESMLVKTLKYILPDRKFKILGAGRTDAKVSALEAAFELYLEDEPILNNEEFLNVFNKNLPPDIRVLSVIEVDETFNIIQHSKEKEYIYLFAFGKKSHPFCAPYLVTFIEDLDLASMISVAKLFEGTHNFKSYTVRHQNDTKFTRTITSCEIKENTILSANFFPDKSYALHVKGEGFMRYQIRMIMGVLVQVGKGELTQEEVIHSLSEESNVLLPYVAPGSGLLLNQLTFV
ncbi:tRNA pseudouridine(38-40) synthase TruA [Cellulophaga tyrosinoxydans]|uniref:tRNA pseudouridine synthase A n=1 Tax=Cellulophaga tyrosinoxydans TaxID=504486 RepID=A0A1W2BLM0_9FLAO|nr:tRNA pseudouridine(38-40) synthase TruA [Cellulophaga tyrosinoxydans]SMC73756.1 tRNA pseudouridine38-40 synthase [Cellulophaga tyrosinoxydans]